MHRVRTARPDLRLLALVGVVVLLLRPVPDQAALERALRADLQTAPEEQGRLSPPASNSLRSSAGGA